MQPEFEFILKKASIHDTDAIFSLLNSFAQQKLLLPRTKEQISEQVQDFRVIFKVVANHQESAQELIACAHLDIFTSQLAEVKSLAVHESFQKHGLGRILVEDCENEARKIDIKTIFALTYQIDFFKKLNYHQVDIQSLPEKVFKECIVCPFYGACNENAFVKRL